MTDLLARETDLYRDVFAVPVYAEHSPGAAAVAAFLEMADLLPAAAHLYTVLDAGTGTGAGALALQGAGFRDVRTCDLEDFRAPEAKSFPFTRVCLWHPLRQRCGYVFGGLFDYVYCCDVLEHVPPQFTMLTIARLLETTRVGLFLSISLVPDTLGVWVGQTLHQTVQPFTWWRDSLNAVGSVAASRDCLNQGLFLVTPV